MTKPENELRPENFRLGSLASRAGARSMLEARRKQSDEWYRFSVIYQGFGEIEYIVYKDGTHKKVGHEPTMEEFLAHPALQKCNVDELDKLSVAKDPEPRVQNGKRNLR